MKDKILALAKKFNELAKRGEGGEKETAMRMLNALMKEHDITMEEIEGEQTKKYWYPVRKEQEDLFWDIVRNVTGMTNIHYSHKLGTKKKPREFGITLNASEALEVYGKFEFYWTLYKAELDTFYTAFIMKHELYRKNGNARKWSELTKEEKDRYRRANAMTDALKDESYTKKLNG